jgi:hypothetical protein
VTEISRKTSNKSFNVRSDQELKWLWEDIINSSGASCDFNIGEGSWFEMEPDGVT